MRIFFYLLIIGSVLLTSCDEEQPGTTLKAKEHFLRGNNYYKQEKYSLAIKEYDKALRFDSKHAMVYLKRGDSYRKLRKPNQAIRDYTTVISLRPSNARAWHHRGTMKIKLGKKREGCEDVRKAKELCYVPAESYYKQFCE